MGSDVITVLSKICIAYGKVKSSQPDSWFTFHDVLRRNLDFIGLSDQALHLITRRKSWIEYKIMRQINVLYASAFKNGKHLCHLATLQIRLIGEDAILRQDRHAYELVVKNLNTSLRFTINNFHIRQCFNTLHQYGQLIQFLLAQSLHGNNKLSESIFETVGYLKYYLGVCLQRNMDFVAEVIAYDISAIVSRAYSSSHPSHDSLLEIAISLLDLGRKRGIRCAMVKLACAYMHREGAECINVQKIRLALDADSSANLQAVWNELASTTKRDFWEVSDRGTNMNYLTPSHRQELPLFFALFRDKELEHPEAVDKNKVDPMDHDHHMLEQALMHSMASGGSGGSGNNTGTTTPIDDPFHSRGKALTHAKSSKLIRPDPEQPLPPEVVAALPEQVQGEETAKATKFSSHLRPALVMTVVLALLLFVILLLGDIMLGHGFSARFRATGMSNAAQASSASMFLFSAVEVMGILLTLVVTVSIVVVHITAARFTPLITWLFFHDKTVFSMLALLAANNVFVFWLDYSINVDHIPSWGIFIALCVVTASLFLLMPYVSYILEFFNPGHIIARVLYNLLKTATPRKGESVQSVIKRQTAILEKLDDLVHLSLKAAQWRDSTMVSYITGAFSTFVTQYWDVKAGVERFDQWFLTPESFRNNMAFVFMTEKEREFLNNAGNWLEWKVLYSYQVMMTELLDHYSGQVFLVSNNTLNVGKVAVQRRSIPNLALVVKFFNTYIRHAMNKKDVRAAFNILNNYRQLAEFTLEQSVDATSKDKKNLQATVVSMAEYFRYYSIIFLERGLYFLCEVIAHDVGMITQKAYEHKLDCHQAILDVFLTVDDVAESQGDEMVLRGIRRAQVKLATVYLANGSIEYAKQIQEDMIDEPQDRLEGILFEMTYVDTSEFWEVTDRGNNLDYLSPDRKAQLPRFLSLFPMYHDSESEDEETPIDDLIKEPSLTNLTVPHHHAALPAFLAAPGTKADNSTGDKMSSLKQVLSRELNVMAKRAESTKNLFSLAVQDEKKVERAANVAANKEKLGRLSRHSAIKALEERTSGKAAGVSNYALPVETTGKNVAGTGISTERMQQQKELFAAKADAEQDSPRKTSGSDDDDSGDYGQDVHTLADADEAEGLFDDNPFEDETDRLLAGVNEAETQVEERGMNQGINKRFFFRIFAFQLAFPLLAFLVYILCLIFDVHVTKTTTQDIVLKSLWPDSFLYGDVALTGIPEVVALHVRIILLVSTIAVQIAAFRFTPLITKLFFHDKVIFSTLSLFVLTTASALWVRYFVGDPYPTVAVVVVLLITIVCFIILIPFFAYVLNFLQPSLIINHLSQQGLQESLPITLNNKATEADLIALEEHGRKQVMVTVDQLSDLGLKALTWRDRIIATKVCHAFRRFCISYSKVKQRHHPAWFQIIDVSFKSGDFVNLSEEAQTSLQDGKVWLEWKVLRQYLAFFNVALTEGKELCYLVSINTRKIGEDAARRHDFPTLDMSIKFFNTFLRFAINARDMRVLYTIIYQYTMLAQSLIQQVTNAQVHNMTGNSGPTRKSEDKKSPTEQVKDRVVRSALFFVYYSNICLERELGFISQVFAYDLGTVVHTAFLLNFPAHKELLELFLTIDDHASTKGDIPMLQAIRRAQVQLATIYLKHGDIDSAKEIYEDMEDEDAAFLQQLYNDLYNCDQREFWEINERGTNLDYIPPERRQYLDIFFRKYFPSVELKQVRKLERAQSILPQSAAALDMPSEEAIFQGERRNTGIGFGDMVPGKKTLPPGANLQENTRPFLWLTKMGPALVVPVTLFFLLFLSLALEVAFGDTSLADFFKSLLQMTQEEPVAFNALLSVPMVVATLLALVISVSTVVVQIAATRFTPLITALFFKDKNLIAVLGFFVCTEVLVAISAHTLDKRHHPSTLLFVVLSFTTVSVILLFPFFSYLLLFLDPNNIIQRIRANGTEALDSLLDSVKRHERSASESSTTGGLGDQHGTSGDLRSRTSNSGMTSQPQSFAMRRQSTFGTSVRRGSSASPGMQREMSTIKADPLSKVFSSANLGLLDPDKEADTTVSPFALSIIDAQNDVTDIIERLTDLGLKALQWKDNTVASNALNSLGDVVAHYGKIKDDLRANALEWFEIQADWAEYSPDFLSLSREARLDLARRETWLEFKAMKAFLLLYNEALGSMKELCFLIGRNSRKIGASAAARGDFHALTLVVRFFNTFLRFALNGKDVRTAYNILHDYRKLGVIVINAAKATSNPETAARLTSQVKDIIGYFAYYGEQFNMRGFPFITVIVAHDMGDLAASSVKIQDDGKPWPFATITANSFTSYVSKIAAKAEPSTMSGIRVAEVKLAIFYKRGSMTTLYEQIQTHLSSISQEVLTLIQRQVRAATENEFWEVNDRGANINYLDPEEMPLFESILERILEAYNDKMAEKARLEREKAETPARHGFTLAVEPDHGGSGKLNIIDQDASASKTSTVVDNPSFATVAPIRDSGSRPAVLLPPSKDTPSPDRRTSSPTSAKSPDTTTPGAPRPSGSSSSGGGLGRSSSSRGPAIPASIPSAQSRTTAETSGSTGGTPPSAIPALAPKTTPGQGISSPPQGAPPPLVKPARTTSVATAPASPVVVALGKQDNVPLPHASNASRSKTSVHSPVKPVIPPKHALLPHQVKATDTGPSPTPDSQTELPHTQGQSQGQPSQGVAPSADDVGEDSDVSI
eukprot:TRINITY_DN1243_c0_g1_i2.p1 TRINITY_DN1243_c0_g1~~TRINITY_DN1243_c0_g1_i2.p1  ORF type:complete len:3116 (-),score=829.27 TRINITY_DN1243_c0_g1_i2:110-8185(-)